MKKLIKGWLKCGVLDHGFHRTTKGSPQGGVISPLLALIALRGLERFIKKLGTDRHPMYVIAYADDIVILTRREKDIHRAKAALVEWLRKIGLKLNPQKTSINHTLNSENSSFEFLGFQVRQHPVGQNVSKRKYKTLITPSTKSVKRHSHCMKQMIQRHRGATQQELIERLNPMIQGWSQYFRGVNRSRAFDKLSSTLFYQLLSWAKRRHANLNGHQTIAKYWHTNGRSRWVFQSSEGLRLQRYYDTKFQLHIKVQGNRSPYDGDWLYWGKRLRNYPGISPLQSVLLHSQDGKCPYCGLNFLPTDYIELHHLDNNRDNNRRHNLALLHRHCHDQAHSARNLNTTVTRDKEPS